ncbi:hypothetical protein QCN29_36265 [Streptomyces sp. HNM0663]|uniref:Uncharacterized protein n=1 Tax=Streptomyces chengmaiensis TaxID=3040919 RepID=A0ABT6I0A1_9ACTN|nr:hypothetical protein [Streptomyces chengmaiensis]MDH2394097.1 hypothetical protein [Streptomyces chengmaiensis]
MSEHRRITWWRCRLIALILPVVLLAAGASVVQWQFPTSASAAPTKPVHTTPPDLTQANSDPRARTISMPDDPRLQLQSFEYVLPTGESTGVAVYPGDPVYDGGGKIRTRYNWPARTASGKDAQDFLNRAWGQLDEIASNPEGVRMLKAMGEAYPLPLPNNAPGYDNRFYNVGSPNDPSPVKTVITRAPPGGHWETHYHAWGARTDGVSLGGSWAGEGVGAGYSFITVPEYVDGHYTSKGKLFAMRPATTLFHELVHSLRKVVGFNPLENSSNPVRVKERVPDPTKGWLDESGWLIETNAEELITHGSKSGLRDTFGAKKWTQGFAVKADPYAARSVQIATGIAAKNPGDQLIQRTLQVRVGLSKNPVSETSFVKASPISQPHRPTYGVPQNLPNVRFELRSGASWHTVSQADFTDPERSASLVKQQSPAPVAGAACGGVPFSGCFYSVRKPTAKEARATEEFHAAEEEGKVFQVPAESEVVSGLSAEEIPVYARAAVRSAETTYAAAKAAGSDLSDIGFTSDLAKSWKNPTKTFVPFGGATSAEGLAPARTSKVLTEGWGAFNEALTPAMAALWINSIAEAFSQDATDLTKAAVVLAPVPVVGQLVGIADSVERRDALSGVVNALALLATVSEMAGQPELAMLFGVVALVTTVVAQIVDWATGKSEQAKEIDARNQAWHDVMKKNVIEKSIPELLSTAQKAFDHAQRQVLFGTHITMETVTANAAKTGHSTAIAAARTANARIMADAEASVGSLRSGFVNGVHQAVSALFDSLNKGTGSEKFTRAYMDNAVWPQWSSDHIFNYCRGRDPNATQNSCPHPEKYIPQMRADFEKNHVKPVMADKPKNSFTASDVKAAQDAVDTRVREGKMFTPMPITDSTPIPPAGFIACADDGGTCRGIKGRIGQVAFGAAGSYVTAPLPSGGIACKASSFPVNPNPEAHQSCFVPAQDSPVKDRDGSWLASVRVCAKQGAKCHVSGTQVAAFGTGATWLVKPVTTSAACTAAAFGGDPAPGKTKECHVLTGAPPTQAVNAGGPYQACAVEGERCHITGTVRLAFGAHIDDEDRGWAYKTVKASEHPDGAPCTIAAFGKDPLPGERKSCYIASPPAPFTFCAGPDQTCAVPDSGTYQAAYGGDGTWVVKTVPAGEFPCKDTSFADVATLSDDRVQGGSRGYCYLSAKDHDLILGADTHHESQSVDADWGAHACARDGDVCAVNGPAAFAYGVYEAAQDKGAYLVKTVTLRDGDSAALCSYGGFTPRDPRLGDTYCFLLNTPRPDFDTAQTDFTYRETKRTNPGTDQPSPHPSDPADPHPTHGAQFSTGFEKGDVEPHWTDTVDEDGGGASNVTGRYDVHGPVAGTRTGETAHTGTGSLKYSGSTKGGVGNAHAYLKVFDLGDTPVKLDSGKTLGYWIRPDTADRWDNVDWLDNNSNCVALDLVFTDGSTLRDSGAVDHSGRSIHPAKQCQSLQPNQWNHVTVRIPEGLNGKEVSRINLGYDQDGPGNADYSGYIDDITIK